MESLNHNQLKNLNLDTDTRLNILVFPCGSEIGLEVHRSLCYARNIHLIGASSVSDHGQFVYKDFVGNLPMISDSDFEEKLIDIVKQREIDIIYPTMDSVIVIISQISHNLNCKIVGSQASTTLICASKRLTYNLLKSNLPVPNMYANLEEIDSFPVFMKPNFGYGSRGAKKINDLQEAILHQRQIPDCLVLEYLPGDEFTVDCFTDNMEVLLFAKARTRGRLMNGISVRSTNEIPLEIENSCYSYARIINTKMKFKGAWFFQVKKDANGLLNLLEVGARLAGSSSLFRVMGINFALLNIWISLDKPVQIIENALKVIIDRALNIRYKLDLEYSTIFVDLDDTIIVNSKININLISFLFHAHNLGKKVVLITRHNGDLYDMLKYFRISELFHEIIHLKSNESKAEFIYDDQSIFIDDSFAERKEVFEKVKIPVFAPDSIDALL